MSDDNVTYYKMMVLLETNNEVLNDEENNNEQEKSSMKVSHEFVDELQLDIKVGEKHLDELNEWFDEFDEKISIPNEGFIKYEITNDGLIILLVNEKKGSIVEDIKKYVQEKCK
ncbi:uncharacterized protein HGUI_01311 [Hanseniaspora guilliermondii]|uniref:Uncharacterized protein n=1 Tax=Hanseniaspora guilliermondii TaxID=56406 RepID=A0A1L0CWB9_9ASCO|nr:uncharacterized protein HGUI_01311 [Hanseniaspora guilliermondii]